MKAHLKAAAAIVVMAACVPAAMAQTTMNMEVKANVTGTCVLDAANALDFGDLDPANATVVNKPTTIEYRCTRGRTPASITIGGKLSTEGYAGSMSGPGGDTIPFSLAWGGYTAGQGMASDKKVSLTVNGTIASGTYANVSAGAYSVQVPVVFTP